MKHRHAAALALVGWYLIAPPPARPRPSSNSAPPSVLAISLNIPLMRTAFLPAIRA